LLMNHWNLKIQKHRNMTQQRIEKAQLIKINWDTNNDPHEISGSDEPVNVQFNPETLKISYSNQLSGGDSSGTTARQFVGSGTTKLSIDLWFDVTVLSDQENDVRVLTGKIIDFIKPGEEISANQYVPPGVRFIWGSFMFDGVVDSINENLEFFSENGIPLRASVSISISSQDIQFKQSEERQGPQSTRTPGTRPQVQTEEEEETLPTSLE
jgi:hypothetical protein